MAFSEPNNSEKIDSNSKHSFQPVEPPINFKAIVGRVISFSPYFITSIILSYLVAFVALRYSEKRYLVKGSILLKEKGQRGGSGMDGAEGFIQGMQLLSVNRNIENEQGVLKSRPMVEETIKKLDFGISYFMKGSVKRQIIYEDLPFKIIIDSNHLQMAQVEIFIKFVDKENVEIWTEEKGFILVPKTNEILGELEPINKEKFPIKDFISSKDFRFKAILNGLNNIELDIVYSFRLNSIKEQIGEFYDKFTIKPINKQASILEVSMEGQNAEKMIAFINQHFNSYIQKGIDEKTVVTQNTIKFIDEQLDGIRDTLLNVENNLSEFKRQNNILDLGVKGSFLTSNVVELERENAQIELKGKYLEYLENYIKGANPLDQIISPSIVGFNESNLNTQISRIIELYIQRKTLELSYQPDNPLFKNADLGLMTYKESLLQTIESLRKTLAISKVEMSKRINLIENELFKLPENEQKLVRMTRKFQLSDKLFTYLLEKRAEAGIAGAGINAEAKIVEPSMFVTQTFPKPGVTYLVALSLGFIIPLIIILGLEYFDQSIRNHTQLQQCTPIPLVGSIMHNNKNTALVIANHPKAQVSEAFRNLRSNITYLDKNHNLSANSKSTVLMVTSTISGEGKTFIGMNLSSVLAIAGYKTY
jgi:tyrosine-protein kinase Etk/Wzc